MRSSKRHLSFLTTSALLSIVCIFAMQGAAEASQYDWEIGCYSSVERCWSTNFEPDAGALGTQSRDDDLNSLPTLDFSGLTYGSGGLNASGCSGVPYTGGDYAWGGGDDCGQPCEYPQGVSCNTSPSQFVTENYTDSSGYWHFAMGGASQCESDGHEVPCNVGHRMYPWDCAYQGYSADCTSTSPQDDPFDWDFPNGMYFQMTSDLYVGNVAGPWHAFLCADIVDSTTGALLEICDEPWNSTGYYEWSHLVCNSSTFVTLWQPAGASTSYMTADGTDTDAIGRWISEDWTMSREQFINLIGSAHSECGLPTDEYKMDNWKLYYSENGVEEIGAAGYGAGVAFEVGQETMVTNY